MTSLGIAQPDITLHLDMDGVIRDAAVSELIPNEILKSWIGRPWIETVSDVGSDKVTRMLEDAKERGVSAFRQVTQRFPSGLELPIEYTTVRVGPRNGLMAVGKNLQAVAELQSRLIAAQQAMERDYWKLRDVQSRYRLLFDASNEAILLVRASNLHIVEANPAAIKLMGVHPEGREFLRELSPEDRDPFQAMLVRLREHGKAPGLMVHLGANREPWVLRASMIAAEPGAVFLLQLAPVGATADTIGSAGIVSVDELIGRFPDGFVVVDGDGVIVRANTAFLNLVQIASEGSVIGANLGRWLGRPGADMKVLLAGVRKNGFVRLFSTTLQGDLGTDTEVEISAGGDGRTEPAFVGLLLRDVRQRLSTSPDSQRLGTVLGSIAEKIGKNSLRTLVKDTVGIVERHYIEAALDLTGGNRSAAAEILGLSRQSLYLKLSRYGLDNGADAEPARSN